MRPLPLALKVRPQVYFLWEGIPFDQLGLMEFLKAASFTLTVKRNKPKKGTLVGKPKVGSASLVFTLQSRLFARHLWELLQIRQSPTITVAMAHDTEQMYWIGSFKLDKNTWNYADDVNTVTLNGLSDKVAIMAEDTTPKVFTDMTVREVLEVIAQDHHFKLELDLDEQILNSKITAVKANNEDTWNFLTRLCTEFGAATVAWVPDDETKLTTQSDSYKTAALSHIQRESLALRDRGGALIAAAVSTNLRRVLRISKQPGFLDIRKYRADQVRYYKLGYAPGMDNTLEADVLVQSISITQDGYRTGAVAAVAARDADGKMRGLAVTNPNIEEQAKTGVVVTPENRVEVIHWPKTFPGAGNGSPVQQAIGKDGKPIKGIKQSQLRHGEKNILFQVYTAGWPGEAGPADAGKAKCLMIALENGFTVEARVTLNPGLPFLRPPNGVTILGTDGWDGLYGIEEATLNWSGDAGLTMELSCRAIGNAPPKTPAKETGSGTTRGLVPQNPATEGGPVAPEDRIVVVEIPKNFRQAEAGSARSVLNASPVPEK